MNIFKWFFSDLTKGARDEFRKVRKENAEIRAMPEITREQQTAKHATIIAARKRRTNGDDWRCS